MQMPTTLKPGDYIITDGPALIVDESLAGRGLYRVLEISGYVFQIKMFSPALHKTDEIPPIKAAAHVCQFLRRRQPSRYIPLLYNIVAALLDNDSVDSEAAFILASECQDGHISNPKLVLATLREVTGQ